MRNARYERTYTWGYDLPINNERLTLIGYHAGKASRLRNSTSHRLLNHSHQVRDLLQLAQRQSLAPLPAAGFQGRLELGNKLLVDLRVAGDSCHSIRECRGSGVTPCDDHAHCLAGHLNVRQAFEGIEDNGMIDFTLVLFPMTH